MYTILFDLDGTLLPINHKGFEKEYFKILSKKIISYGYESEAFLEIIKCGVNDMINNTGLKSNEGIFWDRFDDFFGRNNVRYKMLFDEFYQNDFDKLKDLCEHNLKVSTIINLLKSRGHNMVIASNPVFPMIAQNKRIMWANLDYNDFIYITSYENSNYCKPNLAYYKQILQKIRRKASDCVMVGNNVDEDMIAEQLGMKTFLVTDFLINNSNKDISNYNKGDFEDFKEYITSLK